MNGELDELDELDEQEFRLAVQRLARRIRSTRSDEGISDSQMSVLSVLGKSNSATPSELAQSERVSAPSMNRTLNGLLAHGLVAKSAHPNDARRVEVALTPNGRALISKTRRLRSAWFTLRVSELDAPERAALAAALPVLTRLADA